MRLRDLEYIENRLIAPCTDALDAHERMRACGLYEEAAQLMEAVQAFTTATRQIRTLVVDKAREEA